MADFFMGVLEYGINAVILAAMILLGTFAGIALRRRKDGKKVSE